MEGRAVCIWRMSALADQNTMQTGQTKSRAKRKGPGRGKNEGKKIEKQNNI